MRKLFIFLFLVLLVACGETFVYYPALQNPTPMMFDAGYVNG